MSNLFGPDQLAEFREAFTLFDKAETGSIAERDVGTVMRAAGANPGETDVINMIQEYGDGGINFEAFCKMMSTLLSATPDSEEEIIECFKVFDQEGKGTMSVPELKNVMCSLGEKMTDEEVDDMVSDVKLDGDGRFNYAELVKIMMAG